MKYEDKISDKTGRSDGLTVPDGFFEQTFSKLQAELPPMEVPKAPRLTLWQKVRPYVYLAAMFAGIWCMMKMFHTMTAAPEISLETPPALVAQAMDAHASEYYAPEWSYSDYELEQELAADEEAFNEFAASFDNLN